MQTFEALEKEKTRSSDRILVLEKIEGENTMDSQGRIDNRLFEGDNKLHAFREEQTMLWAFKLESGGLPEGLKEKFTNFKNLREHAERYYKYRGLRIKEVKDA